MGASESQEAADLLGLSTLPDDSCEKVLRVGLTRDVCEDDDDLRRWIFCRATELLENGQEDDAAGAVGRAFDEADEQCDFFELERPGRRQTDFGPLEAQQERQQRLGEGERAETRGSQREGAAPSLDPEQARIGERPARLSEFEPGDDDGGGQGNG